MPALSLRSWLVVALVAHVANASPISSLQVLSKDLDGGTPGQNWRRIGLQVINNSDSPFDLRKLSLAYTYADTSKHDTALVWSFVSRTINWSQASGSISDVAIEVNKYNSGNVAGNSSANIRFTRGLLPAHGLIELQFGVHRSDWSVVTQTQDPSYLKVSAYTANLQVPVLTDYASFAGPALESAAASLGLSQLQTGKSVPVNVDNFGEVGTQVYSRKYRSSTGLAFPTVTVDSFGNKLNLDSLRRLDRSLSRTRYGSVSKAFRPILDTLSSPNLPVSLAVIPPNPPDGLNHTSRHQWLDSAKAAIAKAMISKYNLLGAHLAGNTLNATVSKANAIALSWDPAVSHLEQVKPVVIKNDLWASAFRMNVDFLHIQGAKGQGVVTADWESNYPNYADQLRIDSSRLDSAQIGVCRLTTLSTASACNNDSDAGGKTWDPSTSTCYNDYSIPRDSCTGSGQSWIPQANIGICFSPTDAGDSAYTISGGVKAICISPALWFPATFSNQHEAYMCAAIKNNRPDSLNPSFPNNPQYGGHGFAPSSRFLLGNFSEPVISVNGQIFNPFIDTWTLWSEEQNALAWLINNGANVVNQSWHFSSGGSYTNGSVVLGYMDIGPAEDYFDYLTDQSIWENSYTLTQAAGNSEGSLYVVHKGLNSVLVGQDIRDSYAMAGTSSYLNGDSTTGSHPELPDVTAGVDTCSSVPSTWGTGSSGTCSTDQAAFPWGVSIFDALGSEVAATTRNGGSSLASAMTAGFIGDIISIQPDSLKYAPWTLRAITMASADNIEGQWWNPDPKDDQKDGAGRINGLNAYLAAINPFSGTGTAPASGFYSTHIPSGSVYSWSFQVTATQTGSLRVGLSWLAQVDQNFNENLADLDLSVTGLGPDGTQTTWVSASLVNPVEMVHAQVTAGRTYTISVTEKYPASYTVPFGLAWINR